MALIEKCKLCNATNVHGGRSKSTGDYHCNDCIWAWLTSNHP